MIMAARQVRKLTSGCGLALTTLTLMCVPVGAQQKPAYRVIAPEIVPQGEEFTIRVVEDTDAAQPVRAGSRIEINGTVLPAEEGGKVRVPAFAQEIGNQFLIVSISDIPKGQAQSGNLNPIPPHLEVVHLPQQGNRGSPKIWHISETSPSAGNLSVDGDALGGLRNASLRGTTGTFPLNDSVGSSLHRIYRCPADLPKGSYRFVAQDASGRTIEAPNTTTNPTLAITGTTIRQRGQRGKFVITSDVEGDVQLSGGELKIKLDVRTVHVTPNKPGTVDFTALQVGNYDVQARMTTPDAPGQDAPGADANVGKPRTDFNSREGRTSVSAPIALSDAQGRPLANTSVDVALTGPHGIQYNPRPTEAGSVDARAARPGATGEKASQQPEL